MMDASFGNSKRIRHVVTAALIVWIMGCGYAEYEMRLNETRKYYSYLEKLELALAPKWAAPGGVMDLRVPRQFQLLAAPVPIQNDDRTFELPVDTRQPDYENIKLDGLFGAWQASFNVTKHSGSESCPGYIYAISNYESLATKDSIDGPEFLSRLKDHLRQKLNIDPTEEPAETFPAGNASSHYQPQSTFEVCRFKDATIKYGEKDATKYTFEIYSRLQGTIVGIILVVLPVDMEMPQKVAERIPQMLTSFNFTKNPPQPGSAVNGAPIQPKPAGASF